MPSQSSATIMILALICRDPGCGPPWKRSEVSPPTLQSDPVSLLLVPPLWSTAVISLRPPLDPYGGKAVRGYFRLFGAKTTVTHLTIQ